MRHVPALAFALLLLPLAASAGEQPSADKKSDSKADLDKQLEIKKAEAQQRILESFFSFANQAMKANREAERLKEKQKADREERARLAEQEEKSKQAKAFSGRLDVFLDKDDLHANKPALKGVTMGRTVELGGKTFFEFRSASKEESWLVDADRLVAVKSSGKATDNPLAKPTTPGRPLPPVGN